MTIKKKIAADKVFEFALNSRPEDCRFLTAKYLSQKFNVTPSHLSTSFKNKHGIQLKDFLSQVKAHHGLVLLVKKKKMTIKQVSEILDFDSVHGFIHMFKRVYGLTPDDYRLIAVDLLDLERWWQRWQREKEEKQEREKIVNAKISLKKNT